MKNRICVPALAAAALTGTLLASPLVAPVAQAQDPKADHQRCVANREANSLKANTRRAVLERRWEVVGKGTQIQSSVGPMIAYPWCGHGGIDRGYVAVQYRNHGKSGFMEQWSCRWDVPADC